MNARDLAAPRFEITVVPAVYNVSRYLPEFIWSLESQHGIDPSLIEIVAVDDGSTDDSLEQLQEWAARSRFSVTVLTKENGGQGSARNLGMSAAQGRWVTFIDPDDTVHGDYLKTVLAFIRAHPETEMVATARWMHQENTGEVSDTHPLYRMFRGDRLVDLEEDPEYFHGSAPAAFFRTARLRESGLQFDHRIRPNFEDGHFCSRYLLTCDRPLVGFLASAIYYYRKRADSSSTLNTSVARPERFTVVPRAGYLDILERSAVKNGGRPHGWVQNFVLYELSWYLRSEVTVGGRETAATGEVAEQFLALLRQIVDWLDPWWVREYSAHGFESAWRDILEHGVPGHTWRAPYAVLAPVDAGQGMVRVINRFTGPEPEVRYRVDGVDVEPLHTKVRSHVYFDHELLQERLSWLPLGEVVEVRVDGALVESLRRWPRPARVDRLLAEERAAMPSKWVRRLRDPRPTLVSLGNRAVRRAARLPAVRRRYQDAWVLMDRIHDADDSGEHLFAYLREHRPEINAWFVVEKGTPDWKRLKPQYGDRVVAHGSRQWLLLMLNAVHLLSSHVDTPVHRPPRLMSVLGTKRTPWRFTFLQHGVIKDDLSSWLNPKAVDVFVTSTTAEQESIAGDHTTYTYTTREAQLTGLPRFDRLLAAAQRVRPEDRDLVLVAPTWRHWLMPALKEGSQRRELHENFLQTEYAQQWLGFLTDERITKLALDHDLTIGFLPHPNLQSALEWLHLPPHIAALSFTDTNVQELFARAVVLVTDYSSMAFNAAYLDRPVVYFQFDAEAVQAGAHVGRAGYYDYERDGFGPVASDLAGAVAAVEEVVGQGGVPSQEHLVRIADTFGVRDGRCCERVTAVVEALPRKRP